jgi:hypothetical protein
MLVEVAVLATEKCFEELLEEPAMLVFKEAFDEEGASGVLDGRAVFGGENDCAQATLLTLKDASGFLRKPLSEVCFVFDEEQGSR